MSNMVYDMGDFWDISSYNENTIAIVDLDGEMHTYVAIKEKVIVRMSELKLQRRSLLILELDNSLQSIINYLACLNLRQPFIVVEKSLDNILLKNIIDTYKPNFILNNSGLQGLSDYKHTLPDELAILMSTSGTTGSPKLVKLSYTNISSNARAIATYLSLTSLDSSITNLPFSYSYGLSIINIHLYTRGLIVLNSAPIHNLDFWNLVKKYGVTSISGVPYTYQVLKKLNLSRLNLSSIRYMTQAGGKLDSLTLEYVYDELKAKNIEFFVMYGQTEASPRISFVPPNMKPKEGCIGMPIPGGKIEVFDENGVQIIDANKEGELVYSGPNVMIGYATSIEDIVSPTLHSSILKTGDLGYFDESGLYHITGRLKRFVKLFGKRVSLDQIDSWLAEQRYSAVSSGTDNEIIIFYDKASIPIDNLKQDVCSTFGLSSSIVKLQYVDLIPRNLNGKVNHKSLATLVN